MQQLRLCLLVFLLFASFACNRGDKDSFCAPDRQARVIGVKDGDTVEVLWRNQTFILRLAHIDCPERGQPFGKNAKQFVSDVVFKKTVRIQCSGEKDRYSRYIAVVFTPEGKNLNLSLVENGFAWHFKKYSDNEMYAKSEIQARERKVGLWAEINSIPPWEWRGRKKQQ